MLVALICLLCLGVAFGIGFGITGAVLLALMWLIKLPIAIVLWVLAAACCCTVILIPAGLALFRAGRCVLI